jgi:16S rRNA (guanine527-N7)-methyltransferase
MIDALARAAGRPVPRETFDRLSCYVELLRAGNECQNLVSAGTLDDIWERHILDSAQLARFETVSGASWVDVGSGAGLPGIVLSCIVDGPVTLIEPRKLRAEFLNDVVRRLDLNTAVQPVKVERVEGHFDMITGRAVAKLPQFIGLCEHLSTKNTRWVLPKGRNAESELAEAHRAWHGVFHVEPSVTDADSRIIVATEVRAKSR